MSNLVLCVVVALIKYVIQSFGQFNFQSLPGLHFTEAIGVDVSGFNENTKFYFIIKQVNFIIKQINFSFTAFKPYI